MLQKSCEMLLIQHALTQWNIDKRAQGHIDTPLADRREKMESGRYYCAHLHMHSNLEAEASMSGHMFEASRIGVEVIWFTDHDSRFGKKKKPVDGFDFEAESLLVTNSSQDIVKRLESKISDIESYGVILDESRLKETKEVLSKSYKTYCGWLPINFDNPAGSELKLTGETAFIGNQSMKMTALSKLNNGSWESMGVTFDVNGKRQQYSLLSLVTLKIACLVENTIDKDMRVIIEVKMSQQPPEHNNARLRYIIGDTEGLSDDYIAVVKLDAQAGRWQELTLNISEDAERYCVGGQDNVFNTISIILQTRNNKNFTCYFDNFQIMSELFCDDLRERQQQLADVIGKKYGVIPFAANEISSAGQHKNSFCTNVPIINYHEKGYNVGHKEAIDWVKSHNGIFSLNHPFDSWKSVFVNDEDRKKILDRVSENYISARCDGASLIEIGFPKGRHNFKFEDYLELWDRLSKNGIFITGYGDSDNHSNSSNWWDGNNFAAWIYAEKPAEENFIKSMRSGNVFTGDPVIFKGKLSFKTLEGFCMGQVVRTNKLEYGLLFEITDIKPEWTIKWVVDGARQKAVKTVKDNFTDEFSLKVSKEIHFVRVEIYDETGRCVILTNPIYFVSVDNIVIPESRNAYPQ